MPNHLEVVAASCALLAIFASPMAMATEAPRHVYLRVHIDINKDGYFFDPLPIDMTVASATKVACVAFTNDDKACTDVAAAMGRRAHVNPHDSRDGDRHTGTFLAPAGYEICGARIRSGVDAVPGGSSIVASYIRNTDRLGPANDAVRNGLGYDIRLGTGPGRERGIHAVIDLDFIEAALTADPSSGCAPTGSSV